MTGLFEGKVALVTGGASGIGRATVERLLAEGATVVAADVNEGALATLADTTGAHPLRLDVSDPDAWVAALQHIVDTYGRIDIAHLNAGIMTKSEGRDESADVADCLTFEGYRRIRGVNCDGPALGAIALIPHMEGSGGDIVITASVAGLVPFPDDPFYGLTKHAMVGFARSLGPALAPRNIRVNALCPGAVATGIISPEYLASRNDWSPASYMADTVVQILTSGMTGQVWVAYRSTQKPWRYEFAPSRERVVATEAVPILLTTDVAAALDRYRALGFTATAYGEAPYIYGFLELGAAHMHVAVADHIDPRTSNVMAYLYVTDADAIHERWTTSGVGGRFHPPTDTPYGLREGAYVDPDGNLIRYGSHL
jgi:NAD(P)-dependent dehydrogenase (short-subunit alcohol dehydrogenase family)